MCRDVGRVQGASETVRKWRKNGEYYCSAAVGNPLKGHTSLVLSVAYSPNGRHIISGSLDHTIQIWDAEADTAAGKPLGEHAYSAQSIIYSDRERIISRPYDNTVLPVYWTHFHMLLSNPPLVTQCILVVVQSPIRMVGSRTQRVAYYTGYPTTIVKACIHLPS